MYKSIFDNEHSFTEISQRLACFRCLCVWYYYYYYDFHPHLNLNQVHNPGGVLGACRGTGHEGAVTGGDSCGGTRQIHIHGGHGGTTAAQVDPAVRLLLEAAVFSLVGDD